MNGSQIRNILAAGTLTGLVLVMFLVFGGTVQQSEAAPDPTVTEVLQAQNAELTTAVQGFQAREVAFQQQIEAANQTIQQLQNDTDLSQAEGGELATSLTAFQEREAQYKLMIEDANGTIQQLETNANGLQGQYQTDVETLQAQNAELYQAVQLMQQRETQYQAQIELANQTILDLQNGAQQASYGGEYGDDDHEEYEEDDDHEEYEDDEHEAYEDDDERDEYEDEDDD